MTAAPAVAAVWGDVLWCLGLGFLLGAARGGVSLLLGDGPVRCFLGDVMAFAAAAVLVCGFSAGVSASGLARWYMAGAVAVGVLAWMTGVQPVLYRLLVGLWRLATWPLRRLEYRLRTARATLFAALHRCLPRAPAKKTEKKAKNGKKLLQKPSKVVYN